MDLSEQENSQKLYTLHDAAKKLSVSVNVLLSWNENNILKPTITQKGIVAYTEEQLTQFLQILQSLKNASTPITSTIASNPLVEKAEPPQVSGKEPVSQSTSPMENDINNNSTKREVSLPLTKKPSSSKSFYALFISSFLLACIVLTIILFSQQEKIKPFLTSDWQQPQAQSKVLSAQTSKYELSKGVISTLPLELREEIASHKNLQDEGKSPGKNILAQNAIYAKNNLSVKNLAYDSQLLSSSQKQTTSPANFNDKMTDSLPFASKTSCPSCVKDTEDKNSAIDETGNITGKAPSPGVLATTLGGIGVDANDNSFKQAVDPRLEVLFLTVALVSVGLIFRNQVKFLFLMPYATPVVASSPRPEAVKSQIILEVDQKMDGTVVLSFQGIEYKISKPELYSESDQFIERLMTLSVNFKEMDYDRSMDNVIELHTPLSKLVTRLGFVGIKRDLFFPRTSKDKVFFRRYVTEADLIDMHLTTDTIVTSLTSISA